MAWVKLQHEGIGREERPWWLPLLLQFALYCGQNHIFYVQFSYLCEWVIIDLNKCLTPWFQVT